MPLVIAGNSSGSTTVQATDAVTATITLPSATDTLVGKITPSFTTTIGVGAATPSASGAGITFPATQSASTNANTLDDYEEGTFTPTLTFGSLVYSTQAGRYIKIGKLVTFTFGLTTTRTSSSSIFQMSGLPFTVSSGANDYGTCALFPVQGFNRTSATSYAAQTSISTTSINFYGVANSATLNYLVMLMSDVGTTVEMEVTGHYYID
jgi:hypothetical protein